MGLANLTTQTQKAPQGYAESQSEQSDASSYDSMHSDLDDDDEVVDDDDDDDDEFGVKKSKKKKVSKKTGASKASNGKKRGESRPYRSPR